MQVNEVLHNGYDEARIRLLNKWVYLTSKPDEVIEYERVRIKDANYYKHYVEIEYTDGKVERVKFNQIKPIPYLSERDLETLNKEVERMTKYWDESDRDKKPTDQGKRCMWLYDNCRNWLIERDWQRLEENYRHADFKEFYFNFLQLIEINMLKNEKYHKENYATGLKAAEILKNRSRNEILS